MTNKLIELYTNLCEFMQTYTGYDITKVHGIRKGTYVRIRASIIVVMTKYKGTSTVELAELLGMDHTTIIYHRDNHAGRYQSDDDYQELYDQLARYLVGIEGKKSDTDLVRVLGLIRETLSV